MNETVLAQYRRNKRRFALVRQGKHPPRTRHLSQRFYSPEGFFRVMPDPRPTWPLEVTEILRRLSRMATMMPFLGRREKQWRK